MNLIKKVFKKSTFDVAPVIRCRDCKRFMEYRSDYTSEVEGANGDCFIKLMHSNDKQFSAVEYNDYCSYGARKSE